MDEQNFSSDCYDNPLFCKQLAQYILTLQYLYTMLVHEYRKATKVVQMQGKCAALPLPFIISLQPFMVHSHTHTVVGWAALVTQCISVKTFTH